MERKDSSTGGGAGRTDRRGLLRAAAAAPIAAGAPFAARNAMAASGTDAEPFVGVQIAPHNILDEGMDHCLDLLAETARVNALLLYSHKYYSATGRPAGVLAPDHGVPPRADGERNLPMVWVRHNESAFAGTILRHQKPSPDMEYHNRDLFAELVEPARRRGMKIFSRILEPQASNGRGVIGNWERVLTVDLNGAPGSGPCWNHPEYRAWLIATVEDMFRNYELDGLQYGAERVGPLSETLFRGHIPYCFCRHCVARNRKEGIDAERAKAGYRELHRLIKGLEDGGPRPADGAITAVLRVFQTHPEVLAWNYQWLLADEEIGREVYGAAKAVNPRAGVGRHVDHQRSSWDIFYRAAIDYATMAERADFIKPILYHDILGPRLRFWVLERMQQRVLNDLTLEQSLGLFYALMGLDASREPSLDELETTGLSPDYVYRETKRCLEGAGGRAKVYSGIGFDVPWHAPEGQRHFPGDPDTVREAVTRAFEAGADGIVASREYGEMRVHNLRAVGRAVDDWRKAGRG